MGTCGTAVSIAHSATVRTVRYPASHRANGGGELGAGEVALIHSQTVQHPAEGVGGLLSVPLPIAEVELGGHFVKGLRNHLISGGEWMR